MMQSNEMNHKVNDIQLKIIGERIWGLSFSYQVFVSTNIIINIEWMQFPKQKISVSLSPPKKEE